MKTLKALVLLASLAVLLWPPGTSAAAPELVIGTLGDSITYGAAGGPTDSYRGELDRLLTAGGVAHRFETLAWPGARCTQLAQALPGWLDTHRVDILLVSCGTNDASQDATEISKFEAAYRTIIDTARGRGIRVAISWVEYSNPARFPWTPPNEARVNDAIFRQWNLYYRGPGVILGIGDFQKIPFAYLQTDTIHPTRAGFIIMGRIWAEALAPAMGWTLNVPPVCGLAGHRPDGPPYPYTPCETVPNP